MNKLIIVLLSTALLQACTGVVVVGAGVAAGAATDRRTVGTQIDDQTLELKAINSLSADDESWNKTKLDVVVLSSRALLIGQAPTQELINQAVKKVTSVDGISQVLNEVRLNEPVSLGTRSSDSWTTTKIKTKIYAEEAIPPGKIKVITEDSEVFLIGLVTAKEQQHAIDIARNEEGVTKVIKMFELVE